MAYAPAGIGFAHPEFPQQAILTDTDGVVGVEYQLTPCCNRYVVAICKQGNQKEIVWPSAIPRPSLLPHIPERFANEFLEAVEVLTISPKACAALARRCLQLVLLDVAKTTEKKDLDKQIKEVLPTLPARLARNIDNIRVIGNFAAHPAKSTSTGEIIDVEPGEAEHLLNVLGDVFDFYFVEPAEDAARHVAINVKLVAAGKQPKS